MKPEVVKITRGMENIGTFNKTLQSHRKWCKTCGCHVFTEHPTMGHTDVYAGVILDLRFKPAFHVHYQDTVLHIYDGLPKWRNLPKEASGSGENLPE